MSNIISAVAGLAGEVTAKLTGNDKYQHGCCLCGRAREEANQVLLGNEGSVCMDCAQRCFDAPAAVPQATAANGVSMTRVPAGLCVLCGRESAKAGALWTGTQGGVCASCLRLCHEMRTDSAFQRPTG